MTTPLHDIIVRMIRAHGPIDLATYMSLCLTHPEHGYYTAHESVFGLPGDFTTAPEISQLFGEMIGFWVADFWAQMGKPAPLILAELGPGRGTLMRDALRILDRIKGIRQALRLALVEISAARISEQAANLNGEDVTWYDQVGDLPDDAPMIVINNEFFDALPVRQFTCDEDGSLFETCVGLSSAGVLQLGKVACASVPSGVGTVPGVYEISPARDAAARAVFDRIFRQTGAVLMIDYGVDTWAGQSTLQAVRGHTRAGFLDDPGQVDITALVDFSRLKSLAVERGLRVAGPVGQGAFLTHLGIAARADKICVCADQNEASAIKGELARLMDPAQMGTLFRVLCAYKTDLDVTPAGFGDDRSVSEA